MIAKKRYRILAFLFDSVIYFSFVYITAHFFGTLNNDGGYTVNGLPAFLLFLLTFFLWPISEALFGQTLGKKLFDLRVVNEDDSKINFSQAFLRFFFGFVDYMFISGIFVAMSNDKNQRIGDLIAKTKVIKTH